MEIRYFLCKNFFKFWHLKFFLYICSMNEDYQTIVNDLIREDARNEALEILDLSRDEEIIEFINYYKNNMGNIACLHLDTMKRELVKRGLMIHNKTDHFGHKLF